jgi:hypothetical protein
LATPTRHENNPSPALLHSSSCSLPSPLARGWRARSSFRFRTALPSATLPSTELREAERSRSLRDSERSRTVSAAKSLKDELREPGEGSRPNRTADRISRQGRRGRQPSYHFRQQWASLTFEPLALPLVWHPPCSRFPRFPERGRQLPLAWPAYPQRLMDAAGVV